MIGHTWDWSNIINPELAEQAIAAQRRRTRGRPGSDDCAECPANPGMAGIAGQAAALA